MQTAPPRGWLARGIFGRGIGRRAIGVAVCALLAIPSSASAETKYGGWYEVNTPLSIRPDTGPVEQVLSSGNPIMFVDMPVTKDIATVTLGDLRNGAYCTKPAMVDVVVLEHPDGDPYSPHTRLVRSLAPRALSGTQSRITWSIPTMRLRKGVGYSFHVSVRSEGCQQVRYTTWAHTRSPDVNAGTAHCATDATLVRWKRVWHRQGEGATTTCGGSNFAASMPTGWLAARPNPSGGFYISTRSSPTTPTGACVGDYDKYGGRWLAWRADPHNPSLTEYVCVYTQYKPMGVNDTNGFYYALQWIGSATNGVPRDMFLELGTIDYDALLDAHKPLLRYDIDEEYFADSAAEMTDASDNALRRHWGPVEGGTVTIADNTGASADLTLQNLSLDYPDAYAYDSADGELDRLEAEGDHHETASALHNVGYGNHIYGRVVYDSDHSGDEELWLQYWFFYYYNSHQHVNFGPHPGDWEMIQISLDRSLQPRDVTYAQHEGAERCRFEYVGAPGNPSRPVVFVADGSHASYTSAGVSPLIFGAEDQHWGDRAGGAVDPYLEKVAGELHNFWSWPGRWGQDTFGSKSPPAPIRQGAKWESPRSFHEDENNYDCAWLSAARRSRTRRQPAPGLPRVRAVASRAGKGIRVRYRLNGRLRAARGYKLRIVAHTTNPDDMPRSKYVRLKRARGVVTIRTPRGVPSYIVNASVYDRKGRRGEIEMIALR